MRTLKICTILFVAGLLSAQAWSQSLEIANARDYETVTDDLLGSRYNELGLAPGTQLADVTVLNIDGEVVALNKLWADQPLMLVFYRGGWCPYCNAQIHELSQRYPEFKNRGVEIAVVSADKPDAASLVKSSYEIPFPVLSDQDLAAHQAFNVTLTLDADYIARVRDKFGINFSQWSGREHGSIAAASSFLIGVDGTVQWGTVLESYRSRPTPDQLLAAIDQLYSREPNR